MSFTTNFLDLMPDIITCQPGSVDATGKFTASGSPLSLACRITGKVKLVRNLTGQEVVSSVQVLVGSFNNLNVNNYRYTLPVRYNPRLNLKAISIMPVTDETGPIHERVYFP